MGTLLYPKNTSLVSDRRTDVYVKMKHPSEDICLRIDGDVVINGEYVSDSWHVIERYVSDGFLYVGVRRKIGDLRNGHIMVQCVSESDHVINSSFFIDKPIKEDVDKKTKKLFDWTIGSDSGLIGSSNGFVFSQNNIDLVLNKTFIERIGGGKYMLPPFFLSMSVKFFLESESNWYSTFYNEHSLYICVFNEKENIDIFEWSSIDRIVEVLFNGDAFIVCTEGDIFWTKDFSSVKRVSKPIDIEWDPIFVPEGDWSFDIGDEIFVCWNSKAIIIYKQSFEEAITWVPGDLDADLIESVKVVGDSCIVNCNHDFTLIFKPFNPKVKKIGKIDFCLE